jgi:hypothetical protein
MVAGGFDYLLKTRMADMAAYRDFAGTVLWQLPGVRETRTYAVMEEVKNTTQLCQKSPCRPAPWCCRRQSRLPGRRSCPSTGCPAPALRHLTDQTGLWRRRGLREQLRNQEQFRGSSSARAAQARQRRHGARQRQRLARRHAGLGGPPSMLTWMHTCSGGRSAGAARSTAARRSSAGPPCAPSRNARPPAGSCCSGSGRCSAIPGQIAQRGDLVHRFLDVVFAKGGAGRPRRPRAPRRPKVLETASSVTLHAPARRVGRLWQCGHEHLEVVANRGHNPRAYQTRPEGSVDITQLLAFSVKNKASDLHLSAGCRP